MLHSPRSVVLGFALLAMTGVIASAAPTGPPVAPVRPVVTDYFGTKIVDRYRYMEKLGDPKVQAFFRSQNEYTRAVLARLGAPRAKLFARIKQLDNAGVAVSGVMRVGAEYFYEKIAPGQNDERLYERAAAPGSPEKLLIDPDALARGTKKHYTINFFAPSFDGKYVAYGISEGGSENATIRVVDTATAAVLPDSISRGEFGVTSWRPDGKSFYYIRLRKLPIGAARTEKYQKPLCYLHVLGRDPSDDPAVFGYGLDPKVPFKVDDSAAIALSPASPYAIGVINHGVQNELTLYAADAASLAAGHPVWSKLVDVDDGVTSFDIKGKTIDLVTHKGAPTFKVVAMSLDQPDFAYASTIVAPTRAVVAQVSVAGDGLYVRSRIGGFGSVARLPLDANGTASGAATNVALPYDGSIDVMTTDPRVEGATFGLTSWTKSLLYYEVAADGRVRDTKLKPLSPIDESAYTSKEVAATSADGTKVPLSIVYAKNIALDNSHPTYLEGYGAYGITIEPYFSTLRLAWLEHNGVYAVCHVRGGGWYGEAWHKAGMIATKQHTIQDFIACGRYLVDHKYTSPAHLAGEGTSAGGITIGGAITQRPGLFAAALDVVGVSDALRSEFSSNGPSNIPEFGSVKTKAGFKALYGMDAYQHVVDGIAYPAVMLITGINDPRVPPWELAKFTARLQAATSSGRPILLRVDYDAGHGFLNASRVQTDQLLTDQYSFLLWQLGDPAFARIPARIHKR